MIQKTMWQNKKEFQQLSPQKQQMLLQLTNALEGKKITECLPVLLEWKQTMEQNHIVFTDRENQMITQMLMDNLTPAGKQQYEYIKPFLNNKNKH